MTTLLEIRAHQTAHEAVPPTPAVRTAYLYVIYNATTKLSKIGVAYDVERRRRTLELAAGVPLQALMRFPGSRGGVLLAEETAHRRYRRVRAIGEWFALSDAHVNSLASVVRRTIDEYDAHAGRKARASARAEAEIRELLSGVRLVRV